MHPQQLWPLSHSSRTQRANKSDHSIYLISFFQNDHEADPDVGNCAASTIVAVNPLFKNAENELMERQGEEEEGNLNEGNKTTTCLFQIEVI